MKVFIENAILEMEYFKCNYFRDIIVWKWVYCEIGNQHLPLKQSRWVLYRNKRANTITTNKTSKTMTTDITEAIDTGSRNINADLRMIKISY